MRQQGIDRAYEMKEFCENLLTQISLFWKKEKYFPNMQ